MRIIYNITLIIFFVVLVLGWFLVGYLAIGLLRGERVTWRKISLLVLVVLLTIPALDTLW